MPEEIGRTFLFSVLIINILINNSKYNTLIKTQLIFTLEHFLKLKKKKKKNLPKHVNKLILKNYLAIEGENML
jgi:hypothetical protein